MPWGLGNLFGGGGMAPSSAMGVLQPGKRIYAVADIHGRSDLLRKMLRAIEADLKGFEGRATVVWLGDYIDRGPDSAGVVTLLRGLNSPWENVFLRGNHEQALLDFIASPQTRGEWLNWGGVEALQSYEVKVYGATGVREPGALAAEIQHALESHGHLAFLTSTRIKLLVDGYLFVHAGVRPGVPLKDQMENDLLLIREDFVRTPHDLPYKVVFGHTIFAHPLVQDDRIGLDTGAYDSGILSAAALEGGNVRVLQVT